MESLRAVSIFGGEELVLGSGAVLVVAVALAAHKHKPYDSHKYHANRWPSYSGTQRQNLVGGYCRGIKL